MGGALQQLVDLRCLIVDQKSRLIVLLGLEKCFTFVLAYPGSFLDKTSLLELVQQLVRGISQVGWGEVGSQVVVC